MKEKKSVLEEALLQVQNLEEAVKSNSKGILASTMKQELSDLLNEQTEEDEEDPETPENDVADEPADIEEPSLDDVEEPELSDEEPSLDDEEPSLDDEEPSLDEPSLEDDEVLDMTNASDEEVLKVFKAMKPEDGVIVKKDGDNIELSDEDNEYIIKLGEEDEIEEPSLDGIEPLDEQDTADVAEADATANECEKQETVYEITLDEDDSEYDLTDYSDEDDLDESKNEPFEKEVKEDENEPFEKEVEESENEPFEKNVKPKQEMPESARTLGFGYHGGLDAKKVFKAGNKRNEPYGGKPAVNESKNTINEEFEALKKQNQEYKKALGLFKEKLNEVAVFNANLAYATKLFTEHSTTKNEKLNILKRFDSVSTITEGKNLYKTIKAEIDDKKPITESVTEKITSSPKTSATEIIAESSAYMNPQFARIKELMNKIK